MYGSTLPMFDYIFKEENTKTLKRKEETKRRLKSRSAEIEPENGNARFSVSPAIDLLEFGTHFHLGDFHQYTQ